MYCARCKRELVRSRDWTWSILPGGNKPVPTCRDDRLCYNRVRGKPIKATQVSPKMAKVRELAARFAS